MSKKDKDPKNMMGASTFSGYDIDMINESDSPTISEED
jgi:hypothetical protein